MDTAGPQLAPKEATTLGGPQALQPSRDMCFPGSSSAPDGGCRTKPKKNGEKSRSGCTTRCPPHVPCRPPSWGHGGCHSCYVGTPQLLLLCTARSQRVYAALPSTRETEARGCNTGHVHKQCLSHSSTAGQHESNVRAATEDSPAPGERLRGPPHPTHPSKESCCPKGTRDSVQRDKVKPSAWKRTHVKGQRGAPGTAVGQEESRSHTAHGTKSERLRERGGSCAEQRGRAVPPGPPTPRCRHRCPEGGDAPAAVRGVGRGAARGGLSWLFPEGREKG